MACDPPWVPDLTKGILTFTDAGGYVLPNYAARFTQWATIALEVATIDGADTEWGGGHTAQEWAPETARKATLTLQMSFEVDETGAAHPDLDTGFAENWANLNSLADESFVSGVQTVSYVAFDGATAVNLDMKVLPPKLTSGVRGRGALVSLDVILYNPDALDYNDLGAPDEGTACVTPWVPDPTVGGRMDVLDVDDVTWLAFPNYAVRFMEEATHRFGMRQGVGDDVVAIGTTIPYPIVEKARTVTLPMQMTFSHYPDGTPAASLTEGAVRNLRRLNHIAERSTSTSMAGQQTVRWYPSDARPDLMMSAHVGPPILGAAVKGQGCKLGMVVTVSDPALMVAL